MEQFSKIFNINREQAELDFVDISPGEDLPLYLDPYALTTREDTWSKDAHELVLTFFYEVIQSVRHGNKKRGVQLLSHLGEPEETHLGVSKNGNKGRGIGSIQAEEVYETLKDSKAAQSGLLEDLSDLALFIPGIGRDKISDITTNVIRKSLIDYTQAQCLLYSVPTRKVSSGFYWCSDNRAWKQDFLDLPIYEHQKIILVPKYTVRYQVGVDHSNFRQKFVLEFLQEEHLRADDSLVTALKNHDGSLKKKVVYKKTVDSHYPKDKDFLSDFSSAHPEIVDKYKNQLKEKVSKIPDINGQYFIEADLAKQLKEELSKIPTGNKSSNTYHNFCLSVISFIFFPNLIYPKKEKEINEGRKRIDITYTNGKDNGFFYRISLDKHIKANTIYVECKNYTDDIKNPELDQLIGRFDANMGRLGILMFRKSDNEQILIKRCKDVAKQSHGIILPIDDNFINNCLQLIQDNKREEIDRKVNELYQTVIN